MIVEDVDFISRQSSSCMVQVLPTFVFQFFLLKIADAR